MPSTDISYTTRQGETFLNRLAGPLSIIEVPSSHVPTFSTGQVMGNGSAPVGKLECFTVIAQLA